MRKRDPCLVTLVRLAPLAVLACTPSSGANATGDGGAPAITATSSSPASAVVLDANVVRALREASVTDASFARSVFYSWTTKEQADRLRHDKVLLVPGELPSGPTPYVELLERTANGHGAYAELARLLLFHPSLERRRYAWTRAWPTRIGLGDRDYGPELLRIVLQPNAIIARFDPSRPDVFELHDLDDRPMTIGDLLANPSRLAAVLHVRRNDTPVVHREIVLCNESMIAEFSLTTPEIQKALADDRALLAALGDQPPRNEPASPYWSAGGEDVLYATALAFDSDRYRPTPENLRAIDAALAQTERAGAAFVHAPTAKFDFNAVVPKVHVRKRVTRITTVV